MSQAVLIAAAAVAIAAVGAEEKDMPATVGAGAGYYDVLDNSPHDPAADFRLEYRSGKGFLPQSWRRYVNLKPFVGAEATSDGALYGLAGLYYEVPITKNIHIIPSIGAGLYHDGDGKDLGSAIEFRSQVELSYQLPDMSRVGLSFGHISNAGIGNRNPGVEIVSLAYHVPIDKLF